MHSRARHFSIKSNGNKDKLLIDSIFRNQNIKELRPAQDIDNSSFIISPTFYWAASPALYFQRPQQTATNHDANMERR
jgi:hypothetical protein